MKTGLGLDMHRFAPGDHLVLGGVRIPWTQSVDAHSDGDALVHAVCDALLGALALGDIGMHFPDTDVTWRDADSREMLKIVVAMVSEAGYRLGNLDATVVLEEPGLRPHIDEMRGNLAQDLQVADEAISIKATRAEKMGALGRSEGVLAMCTVLLEELS